MARGGECACGTCYACTLRAKGVQVSPAATPTRPFHHTYRPMTGDAWARGIVTSDRPGGFQMPVLDPADNRPMSVKRLAENRSGVEAGLRQLRTAPVQEG